MVDKLIDYIELSDIYSLSAICTIVSCGDPGTSANARRTGDSFLYRDQVTFLCNQGYYQSSGPVGGVRECLITGEWSGEQPICSRTYVVMWWSCDL